MKSIMKCYYLLISTFKLTMIYLILYAILHILKKYYILMNYKVFYDKTFQSLL